MPNIKQRGFSAVEAIIILVVVALLGMGAWWVWDKNQKEDTKQNAGQQSRTMDTEEAAVENQEDGAQTYLIIKEWGVRFKTDAASADAYYLVKPGLPNYAYLSVDSLKNTDCAADNTSTGVYVRFKAGDKPEFADEPYTELYPDAPKVGDYYFIYQHLQALCSEDADTATQAKVDAAMKAFHANVKSVEATASN